MPFALNQTTVNSKSISGSYRNPDVIAWSFHCKIRCACSILSKRCEQYIAAAIIIIISK